MEQDESVVNWLDQLRSGDPAAAHALWDHYVPRMLALARAWNHYWKSCVPADEEDIVQIAFAGFCQRLRRGAYVDLRDPAAVWQVLKAIVTRSAIRMVRDATREKRGGGRVLRESNLPANIDFASALGEIPELGHDPSREVDGIDAFLRILDKLALAGDDLWRIALWKMQGFSNEDLCVPLDCSLATVERRIRTIRAMIQMDREGEE